MPDPSRARAGELPTLVELVAAAREVHDRAGEPQEKYGPDFHAQLKSVELQAKLCGYLDRVQDAEQLVRMLKEAGYVVSKGPRAA